LKGINCQPVACPPKTPVISGRHGGSEYEHG
jgi:hypothetical protein